MSKGWSSERNTPVYNIHDVTQCLSVDCPTLNRQSPSTELHHETKGSQLYPADHNNKSPAIAQSSLAGSLSVAYYAMASRDDNKPSRPSSLARMLMMYQKLVLVLVYAFFRRMQADQAMLFWSVISVWSFWSCFQPPYRCLSSNR